MDDDTRKLLESQDWDTIIRRLVDYAVLRVRYAYLPGGKDGLPGGLLARDLALGAIEKLYSGERKWNPASQPELFEYLKGVVDSLLSHAVESYANLHQVHVLAGDSEAGRDVFTQATDRSQDPLSELIAKEQWLCLQNAARDDEDVQYILYCIEEGYTKPRDMMEKLAWPIERVNNTLKRVRRHMDKCLTQ